MNDEEHRLRRMPSISTSFNYDLALEEQLPLIAAAGFTHVSLGGREAHGDYHSRAGRERLTALLRSHALALDTIHGPRVDPPEGLALLAATVEAAADLGPRREVALTVFLTSRRLARICLFISGSVAPRTSRECMPAAPGIPTQPRPGKAIVRSNAFGYDPAGPSVARCCVYRPELGRHRAITIRCCRLAARRDDPVVRTAGSRYSRANQPSGPTSTPATKPGA